MAATTSGGTTASFSNTPQAKDDRLSTTASGALITEDFTIFLLDVMANDLGGNAKSLWSLDDGTSVSTGTKTYAPADLLTQDTARVEATSRDTSSKGARVWITSDGKVGYDSAAIQASLQALASGETLTDSFTYAIRLGNGTLSWATATVVFAGRNDIVTITSAAQAGTVTEDATTTPSTTALLTASGVVAFSDADASDFHSASFAASASNTTSLGTFALAPVNEAANATNGSVQWTYNLNNTAAQYLAQGQTVTETYAVTINDGHGLTVTQNVVVTIVGTNDAPVVEAKAGDSAGTAVPLMETNAGLSTSGTLTVTDVDLTDTATLSVYAVTSSGPTGGLTLSQLKGFLSLTPGSVAADPGDQHNLTWSFNSGNQAFDFLAAGETLTLSYTVRATDNSGAGNNIGDGVVTIHIVGTNDVPPTAHEGYGLDGYISGAVVFSDANGNGIADSNEAQGVTNSAGHFVLGPGLTSGPLVLFGGTDTATNLRFAGRLTAPTGSTVVTPLTTLINVLAASTGDIAAAIQTVNSALGIAPSIDTTKIDPLANVYSGDGSLFAAGSSLLGTVTLMASAVAALAGPATSIESAESDVYSALATQIRNLTVGTTLDLTNSSVVGGILSVAAANASVDLGQISGLSDGVVGLIIASNEAMRAAVVAASGNGVLDPAALVTNVSAASIVAQGSASTALAQAAAGSAPIGDVVDLYTGNNLSNAIGQASSQVGNVLPPGSIALVSADASGAVGTGFSQTFFATFSPDGTKVLFGSESNNLVPGDTNNVLDGFVKDLTTGLIEAVGVDASGTIGNAGSVSIAFSRDGSKVLFTSQSANLVSVDTNGVGQAYMKDLSTGTITLISTTPEGVVGDGDSYPLATSADGMKVLFQSSATNLVQGGANGSGDLFVKDFSTGLILPVSTGSNGTLVGDSQGVIGGMSADGSKVLITSDAATLVANDINGTRDVFVKDLLTGAVKLASSDANGVIGNGFSYGWAISSDGTKVLFGSDASNLVPGDTNNASDLFVKDLSTGSVMLVSSDVNGVVGNQSSDIHQDRYQWPTFWSADDTKVLFESASSNLVSGDTNNATDVFVKDLGTGAITLVSKNANGVIGDGMSAAEALSTDGTKVLFYSSATNLITGQSIPTNQAYFKDLTTGAVTLVSSTAAGLPGNDYSVSAALSPDGTKAVFNSAASNLVAGDTNNNQDVFLKSLSVPFDTFVFKPDFGNFTINGFATGTAGSPAHDVIDLSSIPLGLPGTSQAADFAAFQQYVTEVGTGIEAHAVITIGVDTINLSGVHASQLIANDFLFH